MVRSREWHAFSSVCPVALGARDHGSLSPRETLPVHDFVARESHRWGHSL